MLPHCQALHLTCLDDAKFTVNSSKFTLEGKRWNNKIRDISSSSSASSTIYIDFSEP